MIDYVRVTKEFNAYYQTSIEALKEYHPQYSEFSSAAIINIQHDFLWSVIPKTNYIGEFEDFTENQKKVYYKALIQQLFYVLKEGDFSAMTGYNPMTNTFSSKADFEKFALADTAKRTLTDGGLMYAACNGSSGFGLPIPGYGRRGKL